MNTATNEQVITALFGAKPENKTRALAILQGREPTHQPEPLDGPLLLKMGEAAQLIPCSRATLWRIFKEGRLEKVELFPGSYRVRKADILNLIKESGVRNG